MPRGNTDGGLTCIMMADAEPKITVDNTNIVSNCQFLNLKGPENSDIPYTQCCTCPVAIDNKATQVDSLWFIEPGTQNLGNNVYFSGQTIQVTGNTLIDSGQVATVLMHPNGNLAGDLNVQNNTVDMTQHPYFKEGPRGPMGVSIETYWKGNSTVGNITVQNNTFTAPLRIEAWDESGQPMLDQMGELVLPVPFPSMPVFFWNDPEDTRLRASYYEKFPGAWTHGDWIEIDSRDGHCVIHGRSDSTLNRGGVRMGSAEFYSIVETMSEIAEALVIDLSGLGRPDRLVLFVALKPGFFLDEGLRSKINTKLRAEISPRHVPDGIYAVPEIPHTLNGKKLEVPIKRILLGTPPEMAVSREAMSNPESLRPFIELAGK